MKKTAVFTAAACILLSGCGVGIAIPGSDSAVKLSTDIFHGQSTFFDRYTSEKDEKICRVRGTIHQAADDQNGGLAYVTAEAGSGSLTVTGSMVCRDGSIRLIYIAPDGRETLIAEGTDRKLDVQVDAPEGEGEISFASDGRSAVCTFDIKLEAGENVSFSGSMEEGESTEALEQMENTEIPEELETPEQLENTEIPEDQDIPKDQDISEEPENKEAPEDLKALKELENIEIPEDIGMEEIIEDNWPESIRYHADSVYANPMSVTFQIDEPMTLSLVCKTRDGRLRLKLAGSEGSDSRVLFDEKNPDGAYTVKIDRPGEYKALFYAEYHVGSVEIVPVEE